MPSHARAVAPVLMCSLEALHTLGGDTVGAATPAPLEQADLGEEKWGKGRQRVWAGRCEAGVAQAVRPARDGPPKAPRDRMA